MISKNYVIADTHTRSQIGEMNRPSNVPPSQQQPPPPNMSARHMHGHHNMRVPPPPLQQVGPPPHGLPLGFPPPAIPPNIQQQQQQQRPNRAQNYHAFMESSNSSSFGGTSGGMPYLHYNRMGGVPANQASKKFHHSSGNKTRTSKFNQHPPEIRQQHHNQTLQQQQQHHGYTIPTQCLTEITTNSSTTSSSLTAISNLKIASIDTTRKPLPQTATTTAQKDQDIYASTSKKFSEISSRQFDVNFQSTSMANITPGVAVAASAPSAESKLDVAEDLSGLTSLKSLSLVDKLEDSTNISGNTTKDEPINTIIEEHEEKKNVVEQLKTDDTKEESPEESAKLEDTTETNDFKSSREKTPMCLVNDLARFNKISFQYRLTGENGPAHCKRFTVTLKLGDEEYVAEGHKIKEAQHLAAKEAILKTKYKNPIPKTNRRNDDQGSSRVNVTPTVELNALAMKLGLQTYYIFDPRQTAGNVSFDSKINVIANDKNLAGQRYHRGVPPGLPPGVQNQLHGIGNVKYGGGGTFVPNLAHHNPALMHVQQAAVAAAGHHRGNFPHCYPVLPPHMVGAPQHHHAAATLFPTPCRITLIVGTQKFVGIGRTIQQAKHDAAAQAIEALKEEINSQQKENDDDKSEDADSKSPISLVFEIGIKRNLPVDFKILREDGPGHMRTFTTACIVGQIVTEAEGTGKKISKKKAAQKMLEELNKLPPVVTPTTTPTKRVKTKTAASRKTGGGNAYNKQGSADTQENSHSRGGGGGGGERVKKRSSDSESADASNPITKLLELFQHKKEKEPIFKLINEGGKEKSRQRQFVVEVSSGDTTVRGVGNSKKTARRNAAQNFLMTLGLDLKEKPPTAVVKEHIEKANVTPKSTLTESTISKETTDQKKVEVVAAAVKELPKEEVSTSPSVKEVIKTVEKPAATSTTSSTGTSISSNTSSATTTTTTTTTTSKVSGLYMKDKLLYLAKLMGFEVDFSDYPKGNHNEFLSIVMISTNPPQICHGIGANAQESQEDAASNALKILSEMGLSK